MVAFLITFIMYGLADFLAVWWAKSIEKSKPIYVGLSAGLMMLLYLAPMWMAFVNESIPALAGMVLGAGVGAYIGCKVYAT